MKRRSVLVFLASIFLMLFVFSIAPHAHAAANALKVSGKLLTVDFGTKTLTIQPATGNAVSLKFSKKTVIKRNGTLAKVKTLVLRDKVKAKYTSNQALVVQAKGPQTKSVSGKLSAAIKSTGLVTIGNQTVLATSNTRIVRNGKIVSLSRLTLQDKLVSHTKAGTLGTTASEAYDIVGDGPADGELTGVISNISGSEVTVTPDNGTANVTVTVSDQTLIEKDGATATLGDLAVGLTVKVTYDPTSFAAFSIEATSSGGKNTSFVKGTVSALVLASSSVSIASDAGTVTLIVDAATEIQVNDVGGTLEDLQLAMPIQAEYDTVTLHAKSIKAGNGDDNHEDQNVQGTVASLDLQASSVTVKPNDQSANVTVFVTAQTDVQINGEPGSIQDISVGNTIGAKYDPSNNNAFEIQVGSDSGGGDHTKHVEGMVQAIDLGASTVTIKYGSSDADVVTVNVTDGTEIKVNDQSATLGDVKVGQNASSDYYESTMNAKSLDTSDGSGDHTKHVDGMVQAIDLGGSTITIKYGNSDQDVITLNVTQATTIKVNGNSATLADVKVGQNAAADYDDTNNNAKSLETSDGGGDHTKHVDGMVQAIDLGASTITIKFGNSNQNAKTVALKHGASNQDVITLNITQDTTIKVNGNSATLADVKVGQNASSDYDDTNNNAKSLETNDADHTKHVDGMVQAIDLGASTVTIKYGNSDQDVITLNITGDTTITVNGNSATLADVTVGQSASADYDETTNNAKSLDTKDENHTKHVDGMVQAVDLGASTVTIKYGDSDQDVITLNITGDTTITVNGNSATLADVTVGQTASADYDDTNNNAKSLDTNDENSTKHVDGMIQAIDLGASTVTVKYGDSDQDVVTLNVTGDTTIKRNDTTAALGDLVVGDDISADYNDVTMNAISIQAWTHALQHTKQTRPTKVTRPAKLTRPTKVTRPAKHK